MEEDNQAVNNSEEDDEYEEEEILVEMKFEDGNLPESLLNRPGVDFKLIGGTTQKPVLQIGEQIFAGQYAETTGTTVIFEEDDSRPHCDAMFSTKPETPLRYYGTTRKCLLMSRIFVQEKKEGEEAQDDDKKEDASGEQDKEPKPESSSLEHEKRQQEEGEGMEDDVAEEDEETVTSSTCGKSS